VTGKSFLMLQKCFELSIYQRILTKNLYCGFHKDMLQQKTFFFLTFSWAANHHIRVISEGRLE